MSTKHKGKGPQALTANALRDGLNVWLNADFTWSQDFTQALRSEDPEVIETMRETGERDSEANRVVGVYFIDIDPETGLPARYRERFRVKGPSYDTADALDLGSVKDSASDTDCAAKKET